MKTPIEFETKNPRCVECEANLLDALDGVLTAVEQVRFDEHAGTCMRCGKMLDEAKRGAVWLSMLRTPRPEPSAELLDRIFAKTSGAEVGYGMTAPATVAELTVPLAPTLPARGVVLPFRVRFSASPQWHALRQNVFQPRLAMTAAMAFFSIALTLNLTGVRLNELHAGDLGPSGLRRAAFDTGARAARYYGNLKVVYVLESRLEDLRKSREDESGPVYRRTTPTPEVEKPAGRKAPGQAPGQAPGRGTSSIDSAPRIELAVLSSGPNGRKGQGAGNE